MTTKRRRIARIELGHVRMKGGEAVAEPGPKFDLAEIKRASAEAAIMAVLSRLTPEEEKY
jgi:hypothetical protein